MLRFTRPSAFLRACILAASLPGGAVGLASCAGPGEAPSPSTVLQLAAEAGLAEVPSAGPSEELRAAVVRHYAVAVHRAYARSHGAAVELRDRIAGFLAAPSDATLASARDGWIEAHRIYGETEVFRFYDGPIDDAEDGPEGRLNGWPLDEAYVDYVEGEPDAGIVADTAHAPVIARETIAALNEQGGEENIAAGFHAIEFLLWGQDLSADGPGDRPVSDYLPEANPRAERRARYLRVATDLVVEDLERMVRAWDLADASSYGSRFVADDPAESIRKILTGLGMLVGDELAGERMAVAYETGDQEDEQSCFSDTTHLALLANARGARSVYLGTWDELEGPGVAALVAALDPELDRRARESFAAGIAALEAIPAPLDRVIVAPRDAPERALMLAAVETFEEQGRRIVEVARALGVELNLGG